MDLSQLITDMKEKGMLSVMPIKFIGKAKPIFEMLAIMNNTERWQPSQDYYDLYLTMVKN